MIAAAYSWCCRVIIGAKYLIHRHLEVGHLAVVAIDAAVADWGDDGGAGVDRPLTLAIL